MKSFFLFSPFAFFALAVFAFVLRCGFRTAAKVWWIIGLFAAVSKYLVFSTIGGSAFNPEFPAALIVLWDAACAGTIALSLFSLVFFFKFRFKCWVLPVVSFGLAAAGVYCGIVAPTVREVELGYPDLPDSLDGYRIVHVSDLHCSSVARARRTETVVEQVNALKADVVCLTGDYVDGLVDDRAVDMLPLKHLRARDGVYFVTGNHEYYYDFENWERWYRENGMRFLSNECVFPTPGLAIGGVNDFVAAERGGTVPDVGKAFEAAVNGEFRVLLQHRPEDARLNIRRFGVDLQLSGHTHGGVAPLIRGIIAGCNGGFSRGVYHCGEGVLYVSSGAGQWAGFLCRFFTPSEIVLIKLKKLTSRNQ